MKANGFFGQIEKYASNSGSHFNKILDQNNQESPTKISFKYYTIIV